MKKNRLIRTWRPVAWAAAFALASTSEPLLAATHTWDTRPDNGQWSLAGNWAEGTPLPSSTTFLRFGTSAQTSLTNNIQDLFWVGGLEFTTTASNYTIGGGVLRLADHTSLINRNATSIQTFNTEFRPDGNFKVDTAGTVTFAGMIRDSLTGSASILTKTGSGTLMLAADNPFRGQIRVDAGLLDVAHANALKAATLHLAGAQTELSLKRLAAGTVVNLPSLTGTGRVNLGQAALQVGSNNGNSTFGGMLSGAGGLTKVGSGTLTLSATSTHTGSTRIQQGQIVLSNADALASSVVSMEVDRGLNFAAIGAARVGGLSGTASQEVAKGQTLTLANTGTASFAGNLTGTGLVVMSGIGTQTLTGTNAFTGSVQISQGTLALGHESALANATIQLDKGGVLALREGSNTIGGLTGQGALTIASTSTLKINTGTSRHDFDGQLAGKGMLTVAGNGLLALMSENSFAGTLKTEASTLVLGHSRAAVNARYSTSDGLLVLAGGGDFYLAGYNSLSRSTSLDMGGANLYIGSNGEGSRVGGKVLGNGRLIKVGAGTLDINGDVGSTALVASEGVLNFNNSARNSILHIGANGTVTEAIGGLRVGGLEGVGSLDLKGSRLFLEGNVSSTFQGDLVNISLITKSGTGAQTFNSPNAIRSMLEVLGGQVIAGTSETFAYTHVFIGTDNALSAAPGVTKVQIGTLTGYTGGINLDNIDLVLLGREAGKFSGLLQTTGEVTLKGQSVWELRDTGFKGSVRLDGGTLSLFDADGLKDARVSIDSGELNVDRAPSNSTIRFTSLQGKGGELRLRTDVQALFDLNSDTRLDAIISGAGKITKAGKGVLTLGGPNSFSGPVFIEDGAVALANGYSLRGADVSINVDDGLQIQPGSDSFVEIASLSGHGKLDLSAHTLLISGKDKQSAYGGALKGTGVIEVTGNGSLNITSKVPNPFQGRVRITDGKVELSNGSALQSAVVELGTKGSLVPDTSAGQVKLQLAGLTGSGDMHIDRRVLLAIEGDQDLSYEGKLMGDGAFIKRGSGWMTLAGKSTFKGQTAIYGGRLLLSDAEALRYSEVTIGVNDGLTSTNLSFISLAGLQGSGDYMLGAGRTLTLAPGQGRTLSYAGALLGTGTLEKQGLGTQTLTSNTSFGGRINILEGTLAFTQRNILATASVNVGDQGVLDLRTLPWVANGVEQRFKLGSLEGSGTVRLPNSLEVGGNNRDAQFAGLLDGTGELHKVGSGRFDLSSASGFNGQLNVWEGQLRLSGVQNLSGISAIFSTWRGSFELAVAEGLSLDYAGTLQGAGWFKKLGPGTLQLSSGSGFAYGGTMQVLDGEVQFKNAVNFLAKGGLDLDSPAAKATFLASQDGKAYQVERLSGKGAIVLSGASLSPGGLVGQHQFDGSISGQGRLLKTSNSTLTLTGPVNLDGTIESSGSGQLILKGASNATHWVVNDSARMELSSVNTLGAGQTITIGSAAAPRGTTTPPTLALIGTDTRLVANGGKLLNNGRLEGHLLLQGGAWAGGSGEYAGTVSVGSGGTFSPGNSPGRVITGSVYWDAGGTYVVDLLNAQGTAGTGWDVWDINGTLSIGSAAGTGQAFNVKLSSQDATGALAPWQGFDASQSHQWIIVRTTDGINPFGASDLQLDTSSFANSLQGGRLGLSVQGKDLWLTFTAAAPVPEPETWALGLAGVGVLWARRRAQARRA